MSELGLVEGFFGIPWSWSERTETIAFLRPHGFTFYLYAPKADAHLRRRWREPHPEEELERLAALAAHCRSLGVRFGVGLSPFELHLDPDRGWQDALARKLADLDRIGCDDLAILFDDMRGDVAELAEYLLHGNAVGVVAGLGDLFGFGEGVEVRARIVCRTVG
jgi:hyaluronoglucosaminidase